MICSRKISVYSNVVPAGGGLLYISRLSLRRFDYVSLCFSPLQDRLAKQAERAQLQKEKQMREDAEKQRRDLEERLQRYEEEVEKARKGDTICEKSIFHLALTRCSYVLPCPCLFI